MYTKLLFIISFFWALQGFAQENQKLTLHFESDKHALTNIEKENLKQWVDSFSSKNIARISICGHTDALSEESYNIDLSERRALVVTKALMDLGVPKRKITYSFNGEAQPIASNTTKVGRQLNRRVEITIEFQKPSSQKPNHRLSELPEWLKPKYQTFYIDPCQDTLLETANHALISIPASAFDVPEDYNKECVEIRIAEAYDKIQMVQYNLQTISNHELLVSGGMIGIEAEICGNPVGLDSLKTIGIFLPQKDIDERMELFTGKRDAGGYMDWTLKPNQLYSFYNPGNFIRYLNYQDCPFFFCRILRFLGINRNETANYFYTNNYDIETYDKYIETMGKEGVEHVEKMKEVNNDLLGYMFQTNNLGWFNCDYMPDIPGNNRMALNIEEKPDILTNIYILFNNRNAVLNAKPSKTYYTVKNMPVNEDITILAIRTNEDKTISLAIKAHTTNPNQTIKLAYDKISAKELKNKISTITSFNLSFHSP
jgi:hypothetical protein